MDSTLTRLQETLQSGGIDTATLGVLLETQEERIYGLSVHGSRAMATWVDLHRLVPRTRRWPVLIGQDEDVADLKERIHYPHLASTRQILKEALRIDPLAWFEQRHQQFIEEIKEFGYSEENKGTGEFYGIPRGTWLDEIPARHEFTIPNDILTGKPLRNVQVALLPTETCWQAPGYLKFGAWNECPAPEEQVAVMRYWFDRFGAQVVGITHDIVEMTVRLPPSTREDSLRLAGQQYLYCQDIVNQGTGTLEALAASLLGGTAWYFWWD